MSENISFLSFQNRFFETIKTIFDLIIALQYDIINDRNDKIDKKRKRGCNITYKESYTVELKRELNNDFKKDIIALANCDGGEIYVGIDDNGKVIGIQNAEKTM